MPKRKATTTKPVEPAVDFGKLNVAALKSECKKRGLDTVGKKSDLVQRLEDAQSKNDSKKPKRDSNQPKSVKEAFEELKHVDEGNKKSATVDKLYTGPRPCQVLEDFDCMLNQTNIGGNNNKYYVVQAIKASHKYYVWTRWGRVGESGQNSLLGPYSNSEDAINAFCKKFNDKTKNKWSDRANFVPHANKYTLIEVTQEDDEPTVAKTSNKLDKNVKVKPCTLDKQTRELVDFIFNQDMFQEALESFNIDTKKMPLGKLSKVQIARGYDVLEEIEQAIASKKPSSVLMQLSSKFYTVIPHSFGRQVPPVIRDKTILQDKKDMLIVLGDIVVAQDLQKVKEDNEAVEVDHPSDINYATLNAKLTVLDSKSSVYKAIETYLKNTKNTYSGPKLSGVWEVDRDGEGTRFNQHKDLDNRRLLWHGTNVAVVAAILKGGLRIMPHSGGRVGQGIYFASENAKSFMYVRFAKNTGIMFLAEVALGAEHNITYDDHKLKAAPKGFDSIIARGQTEPDPKADTTIILEGRKVAVPQGKPIRARQYESSNFSQSEYLVYKESQVRLRYLLRFKYTS